ncbi:MAG: four helix bundle protein [Bacteroidaceae bacterium]|nr:four helix bundle protein [Bacteroidaceae bacterium]
MADKPVVAKVEDFAVRCVKLWQYLLKKQEYDISRQIKRSGTSIGANVHEALCASSKKDYLNKMYIAFKETNESLYWLRILNRSEFLDEKEFNSIYADCLNIKNILTAIIKTTKNNIKNKTDDNVYAENDNSDQ